MIGWQTFEHEADVGVRGTGATVDEARRRAYEALDACRFEGMAFRRDIGLPGAAVSGTLGS